MRCSWRLCERLLIAIYDTVSFSVPADRVSWVPGIPGIATMTMVLGVLYHQI